MFEVYYCPNKDCTYDKPIRRGVETCPQCGAKTQVFGAREAVALKQSKKEKANAPKEAAKLQEKIDSGKITLLVSDDMTEEDIKKLIIDDMINLQVHEAGSGWASLGTILSMNSTDQMLGKGFKALIDQNKILIRQNELILRALQKKP